MRIIFAICILASISVLTVKGQKPLLVMEDSLKVGDGELPGLSVLIPEVNYESTLKNWIKILESGTKSRVVTENGEMSIFGAIIKSVKETPLNVYSILMNRDSLLKLVVVFELKKDQYISRADDENDLSKAKGFLFSFAKNQYIDLAAAQLKEEENKLRDIEKQLASKEKGQSGMERSIRSNRNLISGEREKITILSNEETSLSAALIEHNGQLSMMSPGPEKDQKTAYIKDLEKQKKKIIKSKSSSENKLSKAEKAIEKANRDIPKNDQTQDKLRNDIDIQEANVQNAMDKLNTIKAYR